jgi:hypothetical protein
MFMAEIFYAFQRRFAVIFGGVFHGDIVTAPQRLYRSLSK